MAKIDIPTITAAYDLARQVEADQITRRTAIDKLVRDHGMNSTSATIYVNNLALMIEGRVMKRTMSASSFSFYLDRIADDFGVEIAKKAVCSLRSHIDYYNSLGKGHLVSVMAVCDAADATLAKRNASA